NLLICYSSALELWGQLKALCNRWATYRQSQRTLTPPKGRGFTELNKVIWHEKKNGRSRLTLRPKNTSQIRGDPHLLSEAKERIHSSQHVATRLIGHT
ncbi:hypothetical protein, partial [Desulfobulbus propionicus]